MLYFSFLLFVYFFRFFSYSSVIYDIYYITAVSLPSTPPRPLLPLLPLPYPSSTPPQFSLNKQKASQRYQVNILYFLSYWVTLNHVIIRILSFHILLWSWESHLIIICPILIYKMGIMIVLCLSHKITQINCMWWSGNSMLSYYLLLFSWALMLKFSVSPDSTKTTVCRALHLNIPENTYQNWPLPFYSYFNTILLLAYCWKGREEY